MGKNAPLLRDSCTTNNPLRRWKCAEMVKVKQQSGLHILAGTHMVPSQQPDPEDESTPDPEELFEQLTSMGLRSAGELLPHHRRSRVVLYLSDPELKGLEGIIRHQYDRIVVSGKTPREVINIFKGEGKKSERRTDVYVTDVGVTEGKEDAILSELSARFPSAGVVFVDPLSVGSYPQKSFLGVLSVEYVPRGEIIDERYSTLQSAINRALLRSREKRREEGLNALRTTLEALRYNLDSISAGRLNHRDLLPEDLKRLYLLSERVVTAADLEAIRRTVFFLRENVTEQGVVVVGGDYVVKVVSRDRARAVVADAAFLTSYQEAFPMERVLLALVHPEYRVALVWKEYVPGPTLMDVVEHIASGSRPKPLKHFRRALVDLALERVDFWERNASDRFVVEGNRDPAVVVDGYIKNLELALGALEKRYGHPLTEAQHDIYTQAIAALNYPQLVTGDDLVRRMDSTFRNMILRTDIPEPDDTTLRPEWVTKRSEWVAKVIGSFLCQNNKTNTAKLRESVVHVDLSDRYGHVLENMLQVLETRDSGLSPLDIVQLLSAKVGMIEDSQKQHRVRESMGPLGFYRTMREAYFFVERFVPDHYYDGERIEQVGTSDFEERHTHLLIGIHHYVQRALTWLGYVKTGEQAKLNDLVSRYSADRWYKDQLAPLVRKKSLQAEEVAGSDYTPFLSSTDAPPLVQANEILEQVHRIRLFSALTSLLHDAFNRQLNSSTFQYRPLNGGDKYDG